MLHPVQHFSWCILHTSRVTIYSLDILLSLFGTSLFSMSSSNCCSLTFIQISQEAGQVVWYSLLFQNIPQFLVIHTVKGFVIFLCLDVCTFPGGSMVKNLPMNAGDTRDVGLIPGEGISPGVGSGNHSSILAWKFSWTEEPGRLQFMGCTELGMTEYTCTHRVLRTQLEHSRRMFKESKKD